MAEEVFLKVKLLGKDSKVPTRGSLHAAGYDLYSTVDCVIPKHGQSTIPIGISISIPHGHFLRVSPRSGLAIKHGIDVGAGIIDSDFRGEINVILFNHGNTDFEITKGMRCAQIIFQEIKTPQITLVDEHCTTERGTSGFGSTGLN